MNDNKELIEELKAFRPRCGIDCAGTLLKKASKALIEAERDKEPCRYCKRGWSSTGRSVAEYVSDGEFNFCPGCGSKSEIGKTVFLTREEAEAAMKGAEHERD